jgi:type VI secretion system protein ImpA
MGSLAFSLGRRLRPKWSLKGLEVADIDPSAEPGGGQDAGILRDPRVAALCTPFSDTDPCGPDLDMEGDSEYLNFFAGVEGVLPTTFFSLEDGSPFDRSTVDIQGQLDAIAPLLERTRDIRLLLVQARLLILNKDLAGFALNLAAVAYWLDKFWNDVHPRPQGGDAARSGAIGTLDLPTVIFPLQYATLVEARRLGQISYRTWMIASGEVKPRTGEVALSQAALTEAIGAADPDVLATARNSVTLVKSSLDTIRNAFLAHGEFVNLDKLPTLAATIRAFIDPQAAATDAGAEAADASDVAAAAAGDVGPAPASLAQASQALAAVADYYRRSEPSSPILLLIRQAHHLIGKSFFEIMNILIPGHVERAAFQIGADHFFDLPLEKLSNFADVPALPADGASEPTEESASAAAAPRYAVANRTQAIALIDLVHRYFRRSEPSSPVPMLCERARALAERDFMGVLRDVLPKDALRSIDQADR